MKTTLLTLALVAASGVASAQSATTPEGGTLSSTIPSERWLTHGGTPRFQGVQLSQVQMNNNMNANGAAGVSANPNMANAPSQPLTGPARTAQKRIEQDGYKSVQNLQQGSDGLWHGTAMRGNTPVQVTVDRSGRVSAQ